MPDPGFGEVTATLSLPSGENVVNVWHTNALDPGNPLSASDRDDIAEVVRDFYVNISSLAAPNRGIQQIIYNQAFLSSVRVVDMGTGGQTELPTNAAGGAGGHALPFQCAIVASLYTDTPGRSGRGRAYIGPFTVGSVTTISNQPAATSNLVGQVANGIVDLNARLEDLADAQRLCVYSRKLDLMSPITRLRVGQIFDTQRRRRSRISDAGSLVYSVG